MGTRGRGFEKIKAEKGREGEGESDERERDFALREIKEQKQETHQIYPASKIERNIQQIRRPHQSFERRERERNRGES